MRSVGVLLLAMLFATALIAAGPAEHPAVTPDRAGMSDGAAFNWKPADSESRLVFPRSFGEDALDSSDSVCYKIRAYVFKQDDDHAPELKGSTTCGPLQAKLRDAISPEGRLVPAK